MTLPIPDELVLYLVEATPECYNVLSRLNWRYRWLLWDTTLYKRLLVKHFEYPDRTYWALPNGAWHGPFIDRFSNGNISYEYMYVDGERHGKCISLHSTGAKDYECMYDRGLRNGPYIGYDGSMYNNVAVYGMYCNSNKHGKWITIYSGGRISTTYDKGKVDGFILYHDESGSLTSRQIWSNDKLISSCDKFE